MEDNSTNLSNPTQPRSKTKPHQWSDDNDLVALYLSLYGDAELIFGRTEIAKRLGMSEASLRMREGNYRHLRHGVNGLANAALRSRRTFEAFGNQSQADLRDRVLALIAQA